jgi:parallel beta-helix repeat protein
MANTVVFIILFGRSMLHLHVLESRGYLSTYTVYPGQSIQAAANKTQPGDTVIIEPGIYYGAIMLPRSGSPGKPITFEAPNHATIDGNYGPYVWNGGDGYGGRSYINVSGITFQHAKTQLMQGAVIIGSNSNMSNCEVQWTASAGFSIEGSNSTMTGDIAQYNGEEGFKGSSCSNITLTNCTTCFNNNGRADPPWAGKSGTVKVNGMWYVSPSLESGGGKFAYANNITIDGLKSYGNGGHGWDFDIDCYSVKVINSQFHDEKVINRPSDPKGLNIEIDYGPTTISNCTFSNDLGDGVEVASSTNTSITHCTFINNVLSLTDWNRGSNWQLKNVAVSNTIFNNSQINTSGNTVPWNASSAKAMNITFSDNTFINSPPGNEWQWNGIEYSATTGLKVLNLGS